MPQYDSLESSLDSSKLADVSQNTSATKSAAKHKMVLRQTKVKPRKEQL